MSTKVKEGLFELIKSLSKSEKRYFKLISSRHTIGDENNYVRLFDYIAKQDEYNEEAVFKEFKNEAFLNRFSITKKRLYDHVLSALDAFYTSTSIDAQIYKYMHSAEILYTKSLYEQCGRILRSAEKFAEKHERHTLILEIRRKKKKLLENNGYSDVTVEDLKEIEVKDGAILKELELYNQLWKIKSDLFFQLSRKGKARSDEEKEQFNLIFKRLPENLKTTEMAFDSAYLYNHIRSAYWFASGNLEKSFIYIKANLLTFELREGVIETNLNSYFSLLTNAIYVSEELGYHKDSSLLLKKLKEIPDNYALEQNEDLQIKLFASTSSIELSILTHKGEYQKAYNLIESIEKNLKLYGEKISPVRKAFIQFKIATIKLGQKDFSGALKWINSILNDTELDESEDILSYTHILDLLAHLELNHNEFLPYSLKSTLRFLKSRNRLYSFEKAFLQFVSKRIKCTNTIDAEELWNELYKELSSIKEDSFEGLAVEYFDFISWAESKIKNKSFVEIVSEKYQLKYNKVVSII
ncbi:MAG: hypothetical protein RI883_2079 [Bacteroidota bacterium]|jgi:hypothetical protein